MDTVAGPAPKVLFRLGGVSLYIVMMGLPLTAVVSSVALAVVYHYKAAVWTSCKVWNVLPSVSAAVSAGPPQQYLWPMLLGVDFLPRLLASVYAYNHFLSFAIVRYAALYSLLAWLSSALHAAENVCLVVLSFFSSGDYYDLHEASYIGFLVCSCVHMLLTIILFLWSRGGSPWKRRDVTSFRTKVSLFICYLVCVFTSAYLFFRHTWYCEPGVYSLYALFEYLTIFANIAFHGSAVFEYREGEMVFVETPLKQLKVS